MNKQLTKCILDRIQKDHIKQRPRWQFWIQNTVFWIVFVIAAIYGGRTIGVILYTASETELDFMMKANGPFIHHFLTILPFFWMTFFLILIVFSTYGLQHTKKGYKLSATKLLGANIILSMVIGAGFFFIGDAEEFEEVMHRQVPIFKRIEDRRQEIWSNPDEGRLAGTIITVESKDFFILDDFNQKTWNVTIHQVEFWQPFEIKKGRKIRVIGDKIDNEHFEAEVIAPWKKPGSRLRKLLPGR